MSGLLPCGMRTRPGSTSTRARPRTSAGSLQANPKVELCFYDPGDGQGAGRQLRVEGRAEFLDDEALAERLYEARPWLRAITGEGDVRLAIFRVAHGSAWFWTMAANLREHEQERVRF